MRKILIVEDNLMIADMTEDFLTKSGYEVCGIARRVEDAVALGMLHKPDLALIDLRLPDNELGTEVAAKLNALFKLGILYATGNLSELVLTARDGEACLIKPYRPVDLLRGLDIVTEMVGSGAAQPPFPRGFQVLSPPADAIAVS